MNFTEKLLKHFDLSMEDYKYLTRNITPEDLPSYTGFNNVEMIIGRIERALANDEKIIIYGDYDCDGIMSVSILVKAFNLLGKEVRYYIPSRYQDGYGLNEKNVELIHEKGYNLIITVDNGISANEAIAKANEYGIDVIVTDHHEQIREELPDTPYIMHPIISKYGDVYCCGAYVAYMLSTALLNEHNPYLLSLAAIATISDMMSLEKYNRDIVRIGLSYLNDYRFVSIMNLVSNKENKIDENTIGLEIAPKINAIGRLKEDVPSMQRIVRYFVTSNNEDIEELKRWIEDTNSERKETIKQAVNDLHYDNDKDAIIIVTTAKEGVIGLIANKLMNENNKPAIVFCESSEDPNILKGSARAKEGFSIADSFSQLSYLLEAYGGHNLAGGLSIKKDKLDEFIIEFNKIAKLNPFVEEKSNTIDIELVDISKDNYLVYESLKPYGMGFSKPDFKVTDINVKALSYTPTGDHISTMLTKNTKLLGFNLSRTYMSQFNKIDIIGNLDVNIFRRNETIVFKISQVLGQ